MIALTLSLCSGCATSLTSVQKIELKEYESRGISVVEKDPAAGAALGILPGFGSFYVREYGFGVLNLLLWPASILWDPISGYEGSLSINYYATKAYATKRKNKELQDLDNNLGTGTLTKEEYLVKKREIESKYDASSS